ncbi:Rv3654c family TadE-like protein [Agromyces sp. SYSU T00266]|uniref:Rv3654c family TadE-like protein n=1 Tax=Agromyces zhanjiangensis TaxID=3158562 RepID=UPI003398D767
MRADVASGVRRNGAFTDDSGSATVAAVAILGVVVALAVASVGMLGTSVASQRAANAADASALAAADALSGAVAGEPCPLAGELARRNAATLVDCRVEGPVAVVSVAVAHGPIRATASARAGPPGWEG